MLAGHIVYRGTLLSSLAAECGFTGSVDQHGGHFAPVCSRVLKGTPIAVKSNGFTFSKPGETKKVFGTQRTLK